MSGGDDFRVNIGCAILVVVVPGKNSKPIVGNWVKGQLGWEISWWVTSWQKKAIGFRQRNFANSISFEILKLFENGPRLGVRASPLSRSILIASTLFLTSQLCASWEWTHWNDPVWGGVNYSYKRPAEMHRWLHHWTSNSSKNLLTHHPNLLVITTHPSSSHMSDNPKPSGSQGSTTTVQGGATTNGPVFF